MSAVRISYYSDVLCVWAYVAQARVDQLVETFSDQLEIDVHFCSVFPDAWGKIEQNWKDRGGFSGFNQHINDVAKQFPDVDIHERLWLDAKPRTSAAAHLFLKAVEILEIEECDGGVIRQPYLDRTSVRAAREMRSAFFARAEDISSLKVHGEIAERAGVDYSKVEEKIRSSEAITQLALDYALSQKNGVGVSPTFLMNEGRQRLAGNVGYRLLEANVQELLRSKYKGEASWC